MNDTNDTSGVDDTGSTSLWRRRTVLGALGAAPVAAGAALSGIAPGPVLAAAESSPHDRVPRDARPGGAYDRYVADLAAQGKFSGVVMLAERAGWPETNPNGTWATVEKRRGCLAPF